MILEGFEVFDRPKNKVKTVREVIGCTVQTGRIRITTYTSKLLGNPEYVTVIINKDKRKFAIRKAVKGETKSLAITYSDNVGVRNSIRCASLVRAICDIAKCSVEKTAFICTGELIQSNPNMPVFIMFDLINVSPANRKKSL
jgi:hypothetical protein